jgi:NAD(P)-dependent dehydrogenase (short-subunit alcohol dehydrogenase family)
MSKGSERVTVVVDGASGIGWATARPLAVDHCRAATSRPPCPRLTQHDDVVGVALLLAEHVVAVVDLLAEHCDFTRCTHALMTGVRLIGHDLADDIEGTVGPYRHDHARATQLDIEGVSPPARLSRSTR